MFFLLKAPIPDTRSAQLTFKAVKTMYGGKTVAPGDVVYLFASETHGGEGLVARAKVTEARVLPRRAGLARQTPRVTLTVRIEARAARRLGRTELRSFTDWDDGRPETELNFKFWRQATDKLGGISAEAARFLDSFFG